MSDAALPTEAELRYYYFGLHAVLRRYRTMTILGWIITLVGLASFPLSWRLGTPHGLLDTLLSGGTVIAGLAVVQQSVSGLTSYLHVPFGDRPARPDSAGTDGPADRHPAVQHIEELMRDIDEGGWQDAYAAIEKLEKMQDAFGLPQL